MPLGRPAIPAEFEALRRGESIPDEAMVPVDWKPDAESEKVQAARILTDLVERYGGQAPGHPVLTPGVALLLAADLCHLAGGDGRGAYRITHDPFGDRIRRSDG